MGKNMYKIITITIIVILFSSILLMKDIDKNVEAINEKSIETMNDNNQKEQLEKEKENKRQTKYSSWNLSTLYKNNDEWKKSLKNFNKETKELKNYAGKVTKSSKHIVYALNIKENLDAKLESLYAYVSLKQDINKSSYEFMDMNKELDKAYKEYGSICSELELEILKLSEKEYKNLIKDNKVTDKYSMYLNDIRRNKQHYLDSKEEALLSNVGDISTLPKEVYELFINMDKKSALNPAEYATAIENSNRDTRKKSFENEAILYNDNINMLSGLFIGQVKKNMFYSNARGYKTSRDMYMSGDDIDTKVYD
ncbi:MAG: oligoendopeptidase F, partial [Paraclostridium sp.]